MDFSVLFPENFSGGLTPKTLPLATGLQSSVRKGSPMNGYGVYGGKDLRKRYLLSLV